MDMEIGIIANRLRKVSNITFSVVTLKYNSETYEGGFSARTLTKNEVLRAMREKNLRLINAKVSVTDNIILTKEKDLFSAAVIGIRQFMEDKYGTGLQLAGRCMEASEMLSVALKLLNFSGVQTVEGWCCYDDASNCSCRPYDEHTWVEVAIKGNEDKLAQALDRLKRQPNTGKLYIDLTADQFNLCMYTENQYPGIIVSKVLPYGMSYEEPEEMDIW